MYALIYDEHDPCLPDKPILSVHRRRETAERALEKRQRVLGRSVTDCNTRIVWIEGRVRVGESLMPSQFDTWRPGEDIPYGELYSDAD